MNLKEDNVLPDIEEKENIKPILQDILNVIPGKDELMELRDMAILKYGECGIDFFANLGLVAYVLEFEQLKPDSENELEEIKSFDLETEIYNMLIQIAPLSHLTNYDYLKLAIKYCYERTNKQYVSAFIKTVYVDVADDINNRLKDGEENINPMQVERKLRIFIDAHIIEELNKPEKEEISSALAIPTPILKLSPKEFIGFAVEYLRRRENELNGNITTVKESIRGAYAKKDERTLGQILGLSDF